MSYLAEHNTKGITGEFIYLFFYLSSYLNTELLCSEFDNTIVERFIYSGVSAPTLDIT